MDLRNPVTFLLVGYLATILIEMPVLLVGLSARHSWKTRLLAGVWLTACTYPIVVLVLPPLLEERFGRGVFLAVAETFAPVAECLLFVAAFVLKGEVRTRATLRDCAAITLANVASFLAGELYWHVTA